MSNLISTAEAAAELGVSTRRVVALVAAGRLRATRVGRSLVIDRADLSAVVSRPPGRPWPRKKSRK